MLPAISIDISDVVSGMYMSENEVKSFSRFILDRIADSYKEKWTNEVVKNLHSTRATYMRAMSIEYVDDYTVSFVLDGKGENRLALMLEWGISPFDQKSGFRNSPKAHNSGQEDWYLTVPFRIATPEAIAESSVFADKMTREVYNIVRQEGVMTQANLPDEFKQKGIRKEIKRSDFIVKEYEHKSAKLEGLKKFDKSQHHGEYGTFRRVSENSDPESWWHKGFEENDFMGKALNGLSNEIDNVVGWAKEDWFENK